MAYITYSALTLATVRTVKQRLLTPEIAIQATKDDPTIDTTIQSVIDNTKSGTLSNHLDMWLRDVMPDTVAKWVGLRTNAFYRYQERSNIDTMPLYGMYSGGGSGAWYEFGGSFIGVGAAITGQAKPQTFYLALATAPDTTILAGSATNGDRLIDVNTRKIYVNRGDDTVPTIIWQRQNSEDGKDYFINPSVLVEPHTYLVLSRLFELGVFKNRGNYSGQEQKTFMYDGQEYWHNKFISSLYGEHDERGRALVPGVLKSGLLHTDFSNNGDFGDFAREMAGAEYFGCV